MQLKCVKMVASRICRTSLLSTRDETHHCQHASSVDAMVVGALPHSSAVWWLYPTSASVQSFSVPFWTATGGQRGGGDCELRLQGSRLECAEHEGLWSIQSLCRDEPAGQKSQQMLFRTRYLQANLWHDGKGVPRFIPKMSAEGLQGWPELPIASHGGWLHWWPLRWEPVWFGEQGQVRPFGILVQQRVRSFP